MLSNETLVLLGVVSALGYEVVFCRLAGLRAVGCVTVSDNQLVNELCECCLLNPALGSVTKVQFLCIAFAP